MPRLRRLMPMLAILVATGCTPQTAPPRPAYELQTPVRIVEDVHGIPHIYAKNDGDLFFGQGYMMATLRPAQSEMFRLYSQGRRAELLGEDALTEDYFVRAMDFVGFAERNWATLASERPEFTTAFAAFAAGINRRYDEYRKTGWPATLQVMMDAGWTPTDWTGIEVFAVVQLLGFGLSGGPNVEIEISIALVLLGADTFYDLFRFRAPGGVYAIPDWYETSGIRPPAVASNQLAPLRELRAPLADLLGNLDSQSVRRLLSTVRKLRGVDLGGSNHFAIAGSKRDDGIAVLSSDTHQGAPIPGPYVLMHLNSMDGGGTQNIIGAAFPGSPAVVFGHNGRVAWAPTIGCQDITDFYLEVADPNDPTRVLRPGGVSLPTTERREVFRVRLPDGRFEVRTVSIRDIAGHGPILPVEILPAPLPIRLSVRWTGAHLPGPIGAVYGLSIANTMDDVFDAIGTFIGGTIGFGLATSENRIASSWWTGTPRRDVSGTFKPWYIIPGQHGPHWDGFLPMSEVPFSIDPPRGYVWAANNDPVGNTDDGILDNDPRYYGFSYTLGYRGRTIDARLKTLTERGLVTMAEIERVQHDLHSAQADDLIPYLLAAAARRPDLVDADLAGHLASIRDWDRTASGESTAAALFFPFTFQLAADMLLDDFEILDSLSGGEMQIVARAMMYWLDKTADIIDGIDAGTTDFPSSSGINYFDRRDTPDVVETRDEIFLGALRSTVAHVRRVAQDGKVHAGLRADDPASWRWDRFIARSTLHDLVRVDPTWSRYEERFPASGHYDTPYVSNYVAYADGKLLDRYTIDNQPSNRFLWEMRPEGIHGRFQVPWGQSELPESPHFADLLADYQTGTYRDFPFTTPEVAAVKAKEFTLHP